jgi:hypothetical protein
MRNDASILLRQAASEIRRLRQENQILSAQMFVVEAFHAAALGRPRGQGMSPDLCWEIDQFIAREEPVARETEEPAA